MQSGHTFILGVSTGKLHWDHFECLASSIRRETSLEKSGSVVGHKTAPNKLELPKGVAQLPFHAALSRLSSRLCLCQCNCSSPGNTFPPFRPSSRWSPQSHLQSQVLISCLLSTSWFCLLEHIKYFSQKIKSTYDFGIWWLQGLPPMKNTDKKTAAVVSYSTLVLSSSSLSESVSQKSWGWKLLREIIWSVLLWSLFHLCDPSLDSLHYVPVSLLLRSPELDTIYFMRKPYFQWNAATKDICQTKNSIQVYWLDEYGWHSQNINVSMEGVEVHSPLLTNNTSKIMVKWVCFLTRGGHGGSRTPFPDICIFLSICLEFSKFARSSGFDQIPGKASPQQAKTFEHLSLLSAFLASLMHEALLSGHSTSMKMGP